MILEKLFEKKDLLIYIDLRINQLKDSRQQMIYGSPDKKKERLCERFNGRILELMNIKDLIHNNGIKNKSKHLWKKYNKKEIKHGKTGKGYCKYCHEYKEVNWINECNDCWNQSVFMRFNKWNGDDNNKS